MNGRGRGDGRAWVPVGRRTGLDPGEESPNCGAGTTPARGTVLDNVKAGQPDGKCNRKIPLGEMLNDECRMQNGRGVATFLHSAFIILHSAFPSVRVKWCGK